MPARSPADRRARAQSLPPASEADQRAITGFLDRAWAESGLARLTLDSYRRDLEGLARWLAARGQSLAAVDRQGLFDYLAYRTDAGYAARSNARLLSALRAYFAQQARLGLRDEDPTARLDPPKLRRSLPKALSESEVEALINELPGVAESAVVGVPHPDFGEAVIAVVVARPGAAAPEPAALIGALKGRIAGFKVPKFVEVVAELPRNAMGKVQKNLLRERLANTFVNADDTP
mgnify:CR=1 FL=1